MSGITKNKPIPKGAVCNRCGSKNNLTKDHIIPQQMFLSLSVPCNKSENLQVLCQSCNHIKGYKLDPKNSRTMPLLRKYINQWEQLYSPDKKKRKIYHSYRMLTIKSLTPNTYYFTDSKTVLESIYKRQHVDNYMKKALNC